MSSDASARLQRARQQLAQGRLAEARRDAEAALRSATPTHRGAAELVLAACLQREGRPAEALQHVRAALLASPADAQARYLEAELLEAAGDPGAAVQSLRESVRLQPGFAQAWFYLGILQGEQKDYAGSIAAFETAVRLDPAHARAWNNLGNALRAAGRLDDAQRAFERAVALKPDYWLAVANLAKTLRDTGEVERAEALLRAALAKPSAEPPYRPLLVLLAGLTRERGFFDESAQLYWRAIQAAPAESAGEWFHLGWVLGERGDAAQARDAYARAYATSRRELRALCGMHLALPIVPASLADLQASRARYADGLEALEHAVEAAVDGLTPSEVLDGLRWTNFFLAYQGGDDRALQARFAGVAARAIDCAAPEWRAPLPRAPVSGRRVRIGFASAFFHVGTVGRYFRRWITELPRERFEVFLYHLWPGMDDIANELAGRADHFRPFGGSDAWPSRVAPAIRRDALDALVYPELGMDVTSFALAALRLAPRQFCGWGHPVTTGHATIDAFISCATMEPGDATAQYTERLVLLPGIGTRYERPDVPAGTARERFGLPQDRVLLLCPQSLFKIHPDNDALLAEVLAAHPRALLVLFAGRHPAVTDQFMRRFAATLAGHGVDARAQVRVLPSLPHEDFMRVNLACDAMLDTLHWSGGNTSIDALACGLPIVTLPGPLMRGRQSAAMLRLMGMDELVARDRADYLALAGRLIQDAPWREGLRNRIAGAQHALFGRNDAIPAFQAFIAAEVAR